MANPPKILQSSVFHSVPPDDVSLRPSGNFAQAEASAEIGYDFGSNPDGFTDWLSDQPFQLTVDKCWERGIKGEEKPGNFCLGADFGEPRNAPFERRTVDPTARVHPFYAQSPYGLASLSVSFESEDAPKVKNLGAEYLPQVMGKQVFQLVEALENYHEQHLTAEGKDSGWSALKNDTDPLSRERHASWDKLQQDYKTYQTVYQTLVELSTLPGLNTPSKKIHAESDIDPVWTKLTSLAATILDEKTTVSDRAKAQAAFKAVLENETLADHVAELAFIEPKAKEVGEAIQTPENFQQAALQRIGMKVSPKEESSGASLTEPESTDKNVERFSARLSTYFFYGYRNLQTPCEELILTLESIRSALADNESASEKIQSTLQAAHATIVQDKQALLSLLEDTHTIERARLIERLPRHVIGLKGPGQHNEGIPYPQQEFASAYYGYAKGDGHLRAGAVFTEALTREDAPGTLHDDRLRELSSNLGADAGYVFFTGALAFHPGIDDKLEIVGDMRLGGPLGHDEVGANTLIGGKTTYTMTMMDANDTLGFDARLYNAEYLGATQDEVNLSEWGFQTGVFARVENPWNYWRAQLELGLAGVLPTGKVPREKKVSREEVAASGNTPAHAEITTREGRFFAHEGGVSLFTAIKPEYLFYPHLSVTAELGGEINSDKSNNLRLGAGLKVAY